jgi:two-component system, cell cycle response regulator DivK
MDEKKKKILILEDEADAATYLATLLEDNGYVTDTAMTAEEGMQKAQTSRPDLITLDINLPTKSGIRFYRDIRDDPLLSKVPIVVVTAITGYGGKPEGFRRFLETRRQVPPPEGFVAKPIDREELLKTVGDLLR